jgi:hypothetical protein
MPSPITITDTTVDRLLVTDGQSLGRGHKVGV